jgi:beta-glucuronidase
MRIYLPGWSVILFSMICGIGDLNAQSAMISIDARKTTDLNGNWKVIPDPANAGVWRQVWEEKKPLKKTDFVEYSFEDGPELKVPGDFNTQMPELMYMESTVWYKRTFKYKIKPDKRLFLHFGAVNYLTDVYLNGHYLGNHEGGFTPFQFELTGHLTDGVNSIVVRVNSQRKKDGLPGLGYDWFNYGGITRDVHLIETGLTYIEDYFIQLKKNSDTSIKGWIKLSKSSPVHQINISIPELMVNYSTVSETSGYAPVEFSSAFELWSPENPKRYKVIITTATDTILEEIGFRSIEVKGNQVLLNGKPIFLKGVNIHEERPVNPAKACNEADAIMLLTWAKELGCNLVRLVHYPHNEYMVKLAEKMGLMVWDELPAYQHIEFSAPGFYDKIHLMMLEMMRRDRNRCSVIVWSLSNETYTNTPNRTTVLTELTKSCRNMDSTRLITSVLSNQGYSNNTFEVWDTLCRNLDIIAVNEYLGWYTPWQGEPTDTKWKFIVDKPMIISEFGGEAKFGSNFGPWDEASYWTEEYQENIYRDQIKMFGITPNLAGVCPWILVDYRSPVRMHPVYQGGFNRKGLLSEFGEKKKAWYIMYDYFQSK